MRREENELIRELLLLDVKVMQHLKRDWMSLGERLTRPEFAFVLSKHIGRYGPLDNHLLEHVAQSRLFSAMSEAFDEINCCSTEKDLVEWAEFAQYLVTSTKLIRPTNRSLLASSSSFKPRPLSMKDNRKIGMIQYLPAPIDKLLVCDTLSKRGKEDEVAGEGLVGSYRLALWLLSNEAAASARCVQLLQEPSALLRCAVVVRGGGGGDGGGSGGSGGSGDEVVTLATANDSQRQVLLWGLFCPQSTSSAPALIRVLGQTALRTDDPISVLAHVRTPEGVNVLYAGTDGGAIYSWEVREGLVAIAQRTLEGHKDKVTELVLMPDLRLIASASMDHSLRLWEVDTTSKMQHGIPLHAHSRGVSGLAFVKERRLLLSAGHDRNVYVWNPLLVSVEPAAGKLTVLTGHQHPLHSVTVAAGLIVSADMECNFRIWDVRPEGLRTDGKYGGRVVSATSSQDGCEAGGASKRWQVWWARGERN
jgi:hypothetical protein